MTQSGSPYENAMAERVNGIIKNEFYTKSLFQNYKEAKKHIDKSVAKYKSIRPNSSIDYLTPENAHLSNGILKKRWKKYAYKKKECEFSKASAECI